MAEHSAPLDMDIDMRPRFCRSLLVLSTIVAVAPCATAYRVEQPLEKVVADCDLIIEGTLHDVRIVRRDGTDAASGTISVAEVIWPRQEIASELTFLWRNPSNLACPRVEYRRTEGMPGIWCVRWAGSDTVTARHDAWQDLSKRSELIQALRKQPVVVQIHPWPWANPQYEKTIGPEIHVIARNLGDEDLAIPNIDQSAGTLIVDEVISLEVAEYRPLVHALIHVQPLEPIRHVKRLPRLVVSPGEERRVIIPLDRWYDLDGGTYNCRLRIGRMYIGEWTRVRNARDGLRP